MNAVRLIPVVMLLWAGIVNGFPLEDDVNKCKPSELSCRNSKCINKDKFCDGRVDCEDESDESNSCSNKQCPGYAFRCRYGACINPDNVCDGINDCRDNSDETPLRCRKHRSNSCGVNGFECDDGQCIEEFNLCDGPKDCKDGSDETSTLCVLITCNEVSFKCDYGACIRGRSVCDGVKDCADGSDESQCFFNRHSNFSVSSSPNILKPGKCQLPSYPENGKYVVKELSGNASPGDYVFNGTILTYSCDPQYKIYPKRENYSCNSSVYPQCIKTCPTVNSSDSLQVSCKYKGSPTDCENPYEGTRARFYCNKMYEQLNEPLRYCQDGSWDKPLPKCEIGQMNPSVDTVLHFNNWTVWAEFNNERKIFFYPNK